MHLIVMAAALIGAALAVAPGQVPMQHQGIGAPPGAPEQRLDARIEALDQQIATADEAGNTDEVKRLGCEVQRILLERQPAQPPGEFTRPVVRAPAARPAAGPDVVIHSGNIVAHATDYEMDGTMWTALSDGSDSTVYIYKSADHGQSWIYYWGFSTIPKVPLQKLELVVGGPDSTYIYTFFIHPNQDGDLRVARMGRDTTGYTDFAVNAGPDTVTDFAACRDYSGWNYWLYAMSHNALQPGNFGPTRVYRSTNYARNWAEVDFLYNQARPMMQAGAGKYIYATAVPEQSAFKGRVGFVYSANYGAPGSWQSESFHPDTFEVYDASVAPAFTQPDSEAVFWIVYSHRYQGTDDWDALFTYRNGIADDWHPPAFLAGSSRADEAYLDIRPYTETGNQWINASYCSIDESSGVTTVYRKYTNSGAPADWSDPLQINSNDAGFGLYCRPRLCYSPGVPGTGAGCAFPSETQDALKWNSPWYTGIDGYQTPGPSSPLRATIARGILLLPPSPAGTRRSSLLDISGRELMDLGPGANDVRALAPGVYFVRETQTNAGGKTQTVTKIVLTG